LYSAKWSESGSRNASRRDAVRVSRIHLYQARFGLRQSELVEDRGRMERRRRDSFAESRNALRRRSHASLVLLGEKEWTEKGTVDAVAKRQLPRAHRGSELEGVRAAQLHVRPQQGVPGADRVHS
jgi:hypothetical protein